MFDQLVALQQTVGASMACNGEGREMGTVWLTRALAVVYCLVASAALGQQAPNADRISDSLNPQNTTVYLTAPGTGVVVFRVSGEKSMDPLDRQALLKMVNVADQTTTWQTTEDDSRGRFTNIPYGNYDVEVSAVGYLSVHKEVRVMDSQLAQFEVVLDRDPAAINLDVVDGVLSAKARKEMKRAVSALKSKNFRDAQRHLDEAYQSAPSSPELNFLLGYLYLQKSDYERASKYLGVATTLSPQNAKALTLLGRASLEREDFATAQSALERAVASDGESWLPHDLLADAYFRLKNYGKARDEAQVAISKGKTEASPAQLVLGEALINLGLDQEGIQALDNFLQESPSHAMAEQVLRLIAEVREHDSSAPFTENAAQSGRRLAGVDPLPALPVPELSVTSWQPPGIDETKVALAPGIVCPSERVLEETGKHVGELADHVARFSAVEDLLHQSLDAFGIPIRTETRKYNYVALISEPEPGFLAVEESRADKLELEGYPDKIASTGFAALALVFHPHMRDNFDMKCEGLGDWHGQASWVVNFRQRDDKPSRMHSYKVGKMVYPVKLKGRAWITADKFQIVRIESEMIRPIPEIKLLSEHQVVEYGPIRFDKKNTSLWLPKSAEIYFDFRQHRYYRRHSFDHYMLFAVDADEKRKEPVSKPAEKPVAAEKKKSQ